MHRPLLGLLGCTWLLVACASEADPGLSESRTPQVTLEQPAEPEREALLLTSSDVSAIDGFAGVPAADIADVPLFENPDPRGPCGAVVPEMSFDGLIGRSFTGAGGALIEVVGEHTPARQAVFDAYAADSQPGCAPFESMTNTGARQRVSNIELVELSGIADAAHGVTMTIASGGAESEIAGIQVIQDGRFAYAMLIAETRPTAEDVVALVRRMAARLSSDQAS
jgi:hypothetical protein